MPFLPPLTVTGADGPDSAIDGPQPYTITTAAAVSADPAYSGLDAADVSVTNNDDDTAGVAVAPLAVQTTEQGSGTATFTVVLDTVPSGNVTVALAVPSGYEDEGLISTGPGAPAAALNLDFTPGTWNVPQTVTVTGQDEAVRDGDQAYAISITVGASADPDYAAVDPADVAVTNLDNDLPGIAAAPSSLTIVENGLDSFSVVLSSQPSSGNVVLLVSSSDPTEVNASPGSLTFTTANWSVPQAVTVTPVNDIIPEATENFTITLSVDDAATADPDYDALPDQAVAVTVLDNDGGQAWTKSGTSPVLPVGATGTWDATYVQEPSVIMEGPASFLMWYEGYSKPIKHEQIGLAASPDAVTWTKDAANPVLSHTAINGTFDKVGVGDPCVLLNGPTTMMWYAGRQNAATKDKIGLATSADGVAWTRSPSNPVMTGTAGGWDATGVGSPHVLYDGATYRMWYTGNVTGTRQIGYATSPDGVVWTKPSANPVLNAGAAGSFDASGVMMACVILDGVTYRMWYTGLDVAGAYRIGYAASADGMAWTKYAGNPVLIPGGAGSFDETGVLAPYVIKDGSTLRMWYAGRNAAGTYQVGYATASD